MSAPLRPSGAACQKGRPRRAARTVSTTAPLAHWESVCCQLANRHVEVTKISTKAMNIGTMAAFDVAADVAASGLGQERVFSVRKCLLGACCSTFSRIAKTSSF